MTILFIMGYLPIMVGEFPHSEICGWTDICSCPQLIAACHVLRRLLVPRHSPYALFHLTKSDFACFCVETGLQIYYLLINSRKLFFWFFSVEIVFNTQLAFFTEKLA